MRSAGVARTVAFLRHLPECGYRCKVLTTSAFGGADDALRAWEPLSLYRWLFNRQVRSGQGHSAVRTRPGFLSRLGRALLVPDLQISWLPAAFVCGLRYLRGGRCDLIYSTFPPASGHLLGYFLHRVTRRPWVADFRDSWIYDPLDTYLEHDTLRTKIEARIERRVVAAASAVVVVSQEAADALRAKYADHADKVRVISNGFEGAPGSQPMPPQGAGPMRIVHAGSFAYSHPRRSPRVLLDALLRLIEEDGVWTERLSVVLAGSLTEAEAAEAAALQSRGIVQVEGVVTREEALALQASAHVLLVVDHMRPWISTNVPSKVYEYLALGRPILSLGGHGAVERLVTELGAGLHVSGDDVDAVCAALKTLYGEYAEGTLSVDVPERALHGFERSALTRELADCFDVVLEGCAPCR